PNGEGIPGFLGSAREPFGPPIRDAADSVDRFFGRDLGRDSRSVISLSHLTLLFADCRLLPTWSRPGSSRFLTCPTAPWGWAHRERRRWSAAISRARRRV